MANTNALHLIAGGKHNADLAGEFQYLSDTPASTGIYTLGFCRGVSFVTDIYTEQIEAMQKLINELQMK